MEAAAGAASLVKVIDPAPAQLPAPDAVARALDVLKSAEKPLIILGKGAAYAQADDGAAASADASANARALAETDIAADTVAVRGTDARALE